MTLQRIEAMSLTEVTELGKLRINTVVKILPIEQWEPSWLPYLNNVSDRTRFISYLGYEAALSAAGEKIEEGEDNYILWKLRGVNDDRNGFAMFLGMVCPSTGHHHIIRVPPTTTSIHEALLYINHGVEEFAAQT